MKEMIKWMGLSSVFWLAGPLCGQAEDVDGASNQVQNRTQVQADAGEQIREKVEERRQIQPGSQAGDLLQLRLQYRQQTMLLLKERQELVQRFRNASEAEKAQIRQRLRAQQEAIAETHRELRAQIRQQVREIRAEHQEQNQNQNQGG